MIMGSLLFLLSSLLAFDCTQTLKGLGVTEKEHLQYEKLLEQKLRSSAADPDNEEKILKITEQMTGIQDWGFPYFEIPKMGTNVDETKVTYLKPHELSPYRIFFENGMVLNGQNRPVTAIQGAVRGRPIVVMNKHGEFFVSVDAVPGKFHHSSFFAGGDVAFAGEIELRDGKVAWLSNWSGHYKPGAFFLMQGMRELQKYHVLSPDLIVEFSHVLVPHYDGPLLVFPPKELLTPRDMVETYLKF